MLKKMIGMITKENIIKLTKEIIILLPLIYRRIGELMDGPKVTCVAVVGNPPAGRLEEIMREANRFVTAGVNPPCVVVLGNTSYYLCAQKPDPFVPNAVMLSYCSLKQYPELRKPVSSKLSAIPAGV